MNTSTTRSRAPAKANGNGPMNVNAAADASHQMLDAARGQLALATDAATILFKGVEAIRKIQLDAAHRSSQRHEMVARQLHAECTPSDIARLQGQLLDYDLKGAAQYWQQMGAAMLNTQVQLMACATHAADGSPDAAWKPALETWQAAVAGTSASAH